MAVVEGELASVGVPAVFRAIANERKTGLLTISRSDAEAQIYFTEGLAYHARMTGSGVRLGTRLISAGHLSEHDLVQALEIQKSESVHRRLGEILVEHGFVKQAQMEAIVRQQIEDTIFEILRWEGGHFRFEAGIKSDEDVGVLMSVENLVMGGARRFREWHQISRRVPSMEAIPRFKEEASVELALTPEEWALVSAVDGVSTIAQLAPECGFTDLEAARAVYGLVTAGLLDLELPEGVELGSDDPELEKVFDELERALEEATIREKAEAEADLAARVRGGEPQVPSRLEDPLPMSVGEVSPAAPEESPQAGVQEPIPTTFDELASQTDEAAPSLTSQTQPKYSEPEPAISEPEPAISEREPVFSEPEPVFSEPEPVFSEPEPVFSEPEAAYSEPEIASHPELVILEQPPLAGALNGPSSVLAEESSVPEAENESPAIVAEERSDYQSLGASLFAELAQRPGKRGQEEPLPTVPVVEEADADEIEREERKQEVLADSAAPRRIDPNVDTTALLREFTGLVGAKSDPVGEEHTGGKEEEKVRGGLFGRRRR